MESNLREIASELSEIEKAVLRVMINEKTLGINEIAKAGKLNIDSVRRAINWLNEKKLIDLQEKTAEKFVVTEKADDLPEKKFLLALEELNGKASLNEIGKKAGLSREEFNAALGTNKKLCYIGIISGNVELNEVGRDALQNGLYTEKIIERVKNNEANGEELLELIKRGLVKKDFEKEISVKINSDGIKVNELSSEVKERAFVLQAKVKPIFIGKRHSYARFINKLKHHLCNLGFKEMPERLITQEFYNFDVLFQPQNHPARTWTDTYTLKNPTKGDLPSREIVERVKHAHEHGGNTGSTGWQYEWSEDIASKLMPTAHGTSADAVQMIKGVEKQAKYFVINRCYRPDVLDATHLVEFNQLDGFIVGDELNFRNLLYILKELAVNVAGAEEVKFLPDYYPFTEPSVQLSAKHPQLGWIEFAGGGIFRPEFTKTLGIEKPVLGWGMGIDRLAAFKMQIKDIRHLFSDDLNWLRNSKLLRM